MGSPLGMKGESLIDVTPAAQSVSKAEKFSSVKGNQTQWMCLESSGESDGKLTEDVHG